MLASTNSFKIIQGISKKKGIDGVQTVVCAGFILAGQNRARRSRKNVLPPPPAEFESAPGAEPTRGGGVAEIKKVILYSKTDFKRSF